MLKKAALAQHGARHGGVEVSLEGVAAETPQSAAHMASLLSGGTNTKKTLLTKLLNEASVFLECTAVKKKKGAQPREVGAALSSGQAGFGAVGFGVGLLGPVTA